MPTPVEQLVNFIKERRALLGLGHNALARASDLDPGTLANLMVGRVKKAPSLTTLRKLAHGLRVDPELLVKIAGGEVMDLAVAARYGEDIPAGEARKRDPGGKYPLTAEELAVLKDAGFVGVQWDLTRHREILDLHPVDRRWIFFNLENFVHTVEVHRVLFEDVRRSGSR